MNEEQPSVQPVQEQQNYVAPQMQTDPSAGWSWGGFMLGYIYLIAVRKYAYLLLYLLILVPPIGPFLMIGIAIYLGVVGKRLAYSSTAFRSAEARDGFISAIDHAGKVLFFVVLGLIALVVLAVTALGGLVGLAGLNIANQMSEEMQDYSDTAPDSVFRDQNPAWDMEESDPFSEGLPDPAWDMEESDPFSEGIPGGAADDYGTMPDDAYLYGEQGEGGAYDPVYE